MDSIIETFFTFVFNVIQQFYHDMFFPLNEALTSLFGEISVNSNITSFYTVLNTHVIPGLSYFVHMIPPNTFNLIVFYYSFLIGFYSVVLVAHYIFVPLRIIKKYVPIS